jgi:hypothetical protein
MTCHQLRTTMARRSFIPALRLALGALVMAPAAVMLLPAIAQAQDDVADVEMFYDELAPYGQWFEHPRWGFVFAPNVDPDWRPYTRGHWAYTEEHGWYWVGEEEFSWAVYHYGRWTYEDGEGWIWIPGTQWAPAWVAWRYSDDYIGWAPLPPERVWRDDDGLSFSASFYSERDRAFYWAFAPATYLLTPGLGRYILPPSRNYGLIRESRFVPVYYSGGRRIFHRGLDIRRFEGIVRRPVEPVRISIVGSPRESRGGFDRGMVPIYRPRFRDTVVNPVRPGFSPLPPRPVDVRPPRGGDNRPPVWANQPRDGRGPFGLPSEGRPIRPDGRNPDLSRPDDTRGDRRGGERPSEGRPFRPDGRNVAPGQIQVPQTGPRPDRGSWGGPQRPDAPLPQAVPQPMPQPQALPRPPQGGPPPGGPGPRGPRPDGQAGAPQGIPAGGPGPRGSRPDGPAAQPPRPNQPPPSAAPPPRRGPPGDLPQSPAG